MQFKELSAGRRLICRSKIYLKITELFADQKTMYKWNFHLQIEEVFHLQIEKVFVNWKNICRSKNYLQIKDLSSDWINVFCRFKSYLQIKEVSICYADQKTIRRLKNYQHIKVRSADISSICRQVFNLLIIALSADTYSIYRLNASSICR